MSNGMRGRDLTRVGESDGEELFWHELRRRSLVRPDSSIWAGERSSMARRDPGRSVEWAGLGRARHRPGIEGSGLIRSGLGQNVGWAGWGRRGEVRGGSRKTRRRGWASRMDSTGLDGTG